jgi:hypothetical protein
MTAQWEDCLQLFVEWLPVQSTQHISSAFRNIAVWSHLNKSYNLHTKQSSADDLISSRDIAHPSPCTRIVRLILARPPRKFLRAASEGPTLSAI